MRAALIAAVGMGLHSCWLNKIEWSVLERNSRSNPTGDVSEAVAKHLPDDLIGAIKTLRRCGFVDGDRMVGATYRRQPVPRLDNVTGWEMQKILGFNRLLDEHDAVEIKYFSKKMPRWILPLGFLRVYLLIRDDGTMKVYAHHAETAAWLFL